MIVYYIIVFYFFSTDKEDRISHTRINTPRLPSPIQISDEDDKGTISL